MYFITKILSLSRKCSCAVPCLAVFSFFASCRAVPLSLFHIIWSTCVFLSRQRAQLPCALCPFPPAWCIGGPIYNTQTLASAHQGALWYCPTDLTLVTVSQAFKTVLITLRDNWPPGGAAHALFPATIRVNVRRHHSSFAGILVCYAFTAQGACLAGGTKNSKVVIPKAKNFGNTRSYLIKLDQKMAFPRALSRVIQN